jgi:hypothetical protein
LWQAGLILKAHPKAITGNRYTGGAACKFRLDVSQKNIVVRGVMVEQDGMLHVSH